MRYYTLVIGCLLVWTAAAAPAPAVKLDPEKEITQLVHEVWGTKQGLPNKRVGAIAQTPDGYLWVGTAEGLARFDGVRFTTFPSSRHPEIGNDDIRSLLVDNAGSLWIGTYGGGVTRLDGGRFTRYTTHDGLAHNIVYRISQVRSGAIWIGTGGGASRLQDGVFTNYTTEQGLAGNVVFSILEDRHGTTWIGTYGSGLSRLRDGQLTTYRADDGLGSDLITGVFENDADDGALWITSYGGGVVRLKDGQFSRVEASNGTIHERTQGMLQDSNGSIWIGTYGGGLSRLHGRRLSTYSMQQGLTDNLVLALFQDREGSLWAGTAGGLERFNTGKVTHYSTTDGLSHNRVYAVYEDVAGALWLGTEGGGLNRYQDGRFTAFTTGDGLPSDNPVSLAADRAGDLWIGTVDAGISLRKNDRFVNFGAAHGIRGLVYSLAADGEGGVWVGTSEGLGRLSDGVYTAIGKDDGFIHQVVRSLHLDRAGDLWIGTNGGGLTRFSRGRFTTYTTRDGLGGDLVYTIHEDGEGTLWIGAKDGGLTRFKDGRFFAFARPGGLPDSAVFEILEANGDLWLSTPSRLLRVARQQLDAFADGQREQVEITFYDEADGVRGSFNGGAQPAGWKGADGRLWFASDAGAVAVDPASISINRLIPPVLIEQVLTRNQRHDPGGAATTTETSFSPGAGNFEFQYTALSLVSPGEVRFKYRLQGFDADWIDAGTRRTAYYTNLPPGRYRFHVIASNNDGVWNEDGASYAFVLEPVFYQTKWFFVLCVALGLLAVFTTHRLRVRHLRVRAAMLATTVEERTRELATANEMLHRISATDALTGIANRRSFDQKLDEEWQRAQRQRTPLSAVMIDIDNFKSFNDSFGHQRGDECLRQVADVLRRGAARSGDLVARYGGEEFVVLLPDTDAAGALQVAERLRHGVESLASPHDPENAGQIITISAGVGTLLPGIDGSRDEIIKRADRCLYEAKRAGRNRVMGDCPTTELDSEDENRPTLDESSR